MKTGYKVCDAMTSMPVTVSHNATIQECAKLMSKESVGSLLIQEGNSLKGIITDEDIVHEIIAKGIDPKKTTVDKHMATKLITISPEKDIFDAVTLMMEKDIKQLPVMNGKKMIGILTLKDVLKIEPELFELIVDNITVREQESKLSGNDGICQQCGNYSKRLVPQKDVLVCMNCVR